MVVVVRKGLDTVDDEQQPPLEPQAIAQIFAPPLPPSHPAEETEQGEGVLKHRPPPPPNHLYRRRRPTRQSKEKGKGSGKSKHWNTRNHRHRRWRRLGKLQWFRRPCAEATYKGRFALRGWGFISSIRPLRTKRWTGNGDKTMIKSR